MTRLITMTIIMMFLMFETRLLLTTMTATYNDGCTAANSPTTTPATTIAIGPFHVFYVSSSCLRFYKYTPSVPLSISSAIYI
mmetsp:Transcript_10188/g.11636  ORF Transcript_10188/g.11636 Transcript_10188/m.11636 type:complete len:82 (-) Transcript_10188:101-346(-)